MSTTDPPEGEHTPEPAHLSIVRGADHCVILARADGDAVAAAGILAAACQTAGTSVQVCVVRTRRELRRRLEAADADSTPLVVGTTADDTPSVSRRLLSPWAFDLSKRVGGDPDPVLALAGVVAAGADPAEATPELLDAASLEPTPGVAIPTADLADGLAHSTMIHAAFSGDPDRLRGDLDEFDPGTAPETLASWLALTIAGPNAVPDRAGSAVERIFRPYRTEDGFETVGGFADVLDALAREAPGAAVSLAFGGSDPETARSIWRDRSSRVHDAVRDADCSSRDELTVAFVDGPVEPTARLLRAYRVETPTVVAVDEGTLGIASAAPSAGESLVRAAGRDDGSGMARGRTGFARIPNDVLESVLDTLEETI